MNDAESFTFVPSASDPFVYSDYETLTSAKIADFDVQLTATLRSHYPELSITTVPIYNCPLLQFAALGHAVADLDTKSEDVLRWRGFIPPIRRGQAGQLGDAMFFAKYHYKWGNEDFILYYVATARMQYLLKEPGEGEDTRSHCKVADSLIKAAVTLLLGDPNQFIYVYDRYWQKSKELWLEVQKASWDKVILDQAMKDALVGLSKNFFDSKESYERYGVPWKRGIILHGPPGNGKTVSLKALMHTLDARNGDPIPTLYSAPQTYNLQQVFAQARLMSPCLLVMEDIETIVTPATRSYFFNEVDGLANNNGILMVASTNYLDRLDPGLSKRPSRFDRKYLFPKPNKAERTLYAAYWRTKLARSSPSIEFPEKLCPAMADLMADFSFAYMQEAFIATLLAMARDVINSMDRMHEVDDGNDGHDDLDEYKIWRVMKEQVKSLRSDMDSSDDVALSSASPVHLDPSIGATLSTLSISGHPSPTMLSRSQAKSSEAEHFAQFPDTSGDFLPKHAMAQDGNDGEISNDVMAQYGVGKNRQFRETAFEWR